MDIEYTGVGLFFHFAVFFLAGYLGRFRILLGVTVGTLLVPLANIFVGQFHDIYVGLGTGLVASACGAIIIPLVWAGRHASNQDIIFVNNGGMGKYAPYFNWIKRDSAVNKSNRKRWTENKNK
ncbi:hypothetical protein [Pseudodesulfovibrio sediminis]|uniref:Uncharacterized protein n=1 Tax=Pseudodesulfovibrio sediminis TaxID=2810563 RepID=A0ABM7PAQ6_9BACT|nr:hypothetical protein [Pseudodesulfovibrio sediminis]BCS90186.1 hypothetical protein PSDVSF_34280 [Pseudodesulfovibrio sediminis]